MGTFRQCGAFPLPAMFRILTVHLGLLLFIPIQTWLHGEPIKVPAPIHHGEWERLLRTYVNNWGLINYKAWKNDAADMRALDQYLAQYAPESSDLLSGKPRLAALINAYNAFTIDWILENYPTQSIRLLDDSWKEKRHIIGDRYVSLNQIEYDNLIPSLGWRVHAVIVCAARSCPPLQTFAYDGDALDGQISSAYSTWLGRRDLNLFVPSTGTVEVSRIFEWFEEDFEAAGGTKAILLMYAPERYREFLDKVKIRIRFKTYHWGLNDQGDLGVDYKHSLFKSLF